MRPYGLPRFDDVANPDVADARAYGLKSSSINLPGKGGDIHNSFRNTKSKSRSRRYYKHVERALAKKEIDANIENFDEYE